MSTQEQRNGSTPIDMIQKFGRDPKGEFTSFMVDRLHEALIHVPVEIDYAAEERYLELRENPDVPYVPLIISSHSIHADALAVAHINHELLRREHQALDNPLDGFILPIATSVGSGHQGELLQNGLPALRRHCDYLGTNIIETTRQSDEKRYGLKRNVRTVIKQLMEAADTNQGITMFPEASVQSGRLVVPKQEEDVMRYVTDQARYIGGVLGVIDAPVHGMQQFNSETITTSIAVASRKGRKALIVPVAIDGINRLVRPTENRKNALTAKSLGTIVTGRDMFAVTMKVGMPFTLEEAMQELQDFGIEYSDQELADLVGRKVAGLLPEDKQGFYREQAAA